MDNNLEAIGKQLQKLPPSTQFAMVKALPNISYGAHWGLCLQDEVIENLESLKQDPNIKVMPIKGGVVLIINQGYLENSLVKAIPGAIKAEDIVVFKKKHDEAILALRKFIEKKTSSGGYKGLLGIFCTNAVTNIRHDNVDYPAFRVDLNNAMALLEAGTGGKARVRLGNDWVSPRVFATESDVKTRLSSLIMSPTQTGVFVQVVF